MKKWWWSPFAVCLNGRCCSSGVCALYRINKDEGDESLPLLAFRRDVVNAIFLKYSKEDIILEPYRNLKYPIRCLF